MFKFIRLLRRFEPLSKCFAFCKRSPELTLGPIPRNDGWSRLNQKGVIHLIPLLLLLIGIGAGVYLVQKEGYQLFKPKAAANPIEWIQTQEDPDNCIISVDGNTATANCSKIKLRLNPPDPNQTSDASFQLIKTARAHDEGLDEEEERRCTTVFFGTLPSVRSSKYPEVQNQTCWPTWPSWEECREDQFEDGHKWAGCFKKESQPEQPADQDGKEDTGSEDGDRGSAGKGGSAAPGLPPVNISPEGTVTVSSIREFVKFYWAGPSQARSYRLFLDSEEDTTGGWRSNCSNDLNNRYDYCVKVPHVQNNGQNVAGGVRPIEANSFFTGKDQIEGPTYTWWVDALDENGETIGTSQGSTFNVRKLKTNQAPLNNQSSGVDPSRSCYFSSTDSKCYKGACKEGVTSCGFNNNCLYHDFGKGPEEVDCATGKPVSPGTLAPGRQTAPTAVLQPAAPAQPAVPGQQPATPAQPAAPAQPGGGTSADCTRGSSPADNRGYLDSTQTECILREKSDLATQYIKWGWCSDDANRQAIANDWYSKLATDAEKQAVSAKCLGAQQSKEVKKVVKYRLAVSSPLLFDKEEWKDITSEPIALNLPGLTTGMQSIFVQFQDDKGQTVKVNGLDWATAYVIFTTPTVVPEKDQPAVPDSAAKEGCPVENYMSFSIEVLIQKCSSKQLSRLPVEVLRQFSNQDLLTIAKALNGENGPFYFLSQFDADRLGSFDLGTLKKLPEGTINSLPDNLKNLIKGGGGGSGAASSEQASCSSVSVSSTYVTVNFSGKVSSLKIWLAANSAVDKAASSVGNNWSQVKSVSSPISGSFHTIETAGFTKGTHAVLVSLHGSAGQMLDGNPNGTVNSACASTIAIP